MLNKFQYPFYTMLHPKDGFDEMRYRNKTSLLFSFISVFVFALSLVAMKQYQGLQFSMADPNETNILLSIFLSYFGVLLFTVSNWAFCVFLEGKATFKELWIITSYSLMPYTFCSFIRVILSNVLTLEEELFLIIVTIIGVVWSFWLLMAAYINFQQYELSRAILAFVLAMVGVAICLALLFLLYSLAQQLFGNAATVFNEVIFRMREG